MDGLALHQAHGVGDFDCRALFDLKQRHVVQQPGEHLLELHALREMVDSLETRVDARGIHRQRLELGLPDRRRFGFLHEVEQAAADAAQRRDFVLTGAHGLREARHLQLARAAQDRIRIGDAHTNRAHRSSMNGVKGVGKSIGLAIYDQVDVALAPTSDLLANVPMRRNESQHA